MAFDKYVKNKKHIIWDWNGTLLDDVIYTWQTGNRLLVQENKKPVSLDFYKNNFCFPVSDYYRKLGFDVDNISYFKQLCHDFVGFYMENIKSCGLKAQMKSVVHSFAKAGLKQSILSAADQKSLNEMVDHFGLTRYFENIYGLANKEATCKLERGGALIDSLGGCAKKEMLIIGDTLHDLKVGQVHGVDVVLVAHGHNSYERLVAKHSMVVKI